MTINRFKNVVHVGLPKTGTTAMQTEIFPKIKELNYVTNYNNKKLIKLTRKAIDLSLSESEQKELDIISNELTDNLVSCEGFVHTNPMKWEEAADKTQRIYGKNSLILLSLRSPDDFLRSIYQQQIHEGNIILPDEYFISNQQYNSMEGWISDLGGPVFNYDVFDYEKLVKIYKERFENVYVLKYEDMHHIKYLDDIFLLSEKHKNIISYTLKHCKVVNKSFSSTAMKITFLRERILNVFGLRSIGSKNFSYKHYIKRYELDVDNKKCFRNKVKLIFSWRWFVTNLLDRVIIFKNYKLDHKIPKEIIDKNTIFYRNIKTGFIK